MFKTLFFKPTPDPEPTALADPALPKPTLEMLRRTGAWADRQYEELLKLAQRQLIWVVFLLFGGLGLLLVLPYGVQYIDGWSKDFRLAPQLVTDAKTAASKLKATRDELEAEHFANVARLN